MTSCERPRSASTSGNPATIVALLVLVVSASWALHPLSARSEGTTAVGSSPPSAGSATAAAQLAAASASLGATAGRTSGSARPAGTPASNWTPLTSPTPSARGEASAAWDPVLGDYVLFGGSAGSTVLNDTWKLSPKMVWTPVHLAHAPSPRQVAPMAYDAADKEIVLFGGDGPSGLLSDTWTFANNKWTQLTPSTHPPAEFGASMVDDTAAGYVLMFGGNTSTTSNGLVATTWEFKAGTWTKLSPASAPSARMGAALAYDAKDGYPLLFGGLGAKNAALGDTWNFSSGSWHALAPTVSPPARGFAAVGYSVADAKVVLTSGVADLSTGHYLSDVWLYGNGTWAKRASYIHPSSRGFPASADGSTSIGMFVFGGYASAGPLGDAWSFAKGIWSTIVPTAPAPRVLPMMAWDDAGQFVLMFGGVNLSTNVLFGDTWKFVGGTWTPMNLAVNPPARYAGMMTFDSADHEMILIGGIGANVSQACDTWAFVSGAWKDIVTGCGAGPSPRGASAITYDAADGYVLLFGGENLSKGQYYNETWSFVHGAWSNRTAVTAPPPEEGGSMAYDSEDGYTVLFGGYALFGSSGTFAESYTWTYLKGTWTNITSGVGLAMPDLSFPALVDDTYDGYLVMFGGTSNFSSVYGGTYNFSAGQWALVHPTAHPPATAASGAAYDPVDDYAVMFGGLLSLSMTLSESGTTWTYAGT